LQNISIKLSCALQNQKRLSQMTGISYSEVRNVLLKAQPQSSSDLT